MTNNLVVVVFAAIIFITGILAILSQDQAIRQDALDNYKATCELMSDPTQTKFWLECPAE